MVGQTFLGLTVNCARCHAHKFDPIPQDEYYRIKSVFDGVRHGERPLATDAELREVQKQTAILDSELKSLDDEAQRIDAEAGTSDRDRQAKRDKLAARKLQTQRDREQLAAISKNVTYAGKRLEPPPTRRFQRGMVTLPQEVVSAGGLSAIEELPADFGLGPEAPEAKRRVKFAEWLNDRRNPLPARVMVNRVWQWHFGQGLVSTPNDFGASGSRPSHPELLDWLASEFMERGWSVKTLHRLIVLSETYRQASEHRPEAAAIDADNTLVWRMSPRRLEAEAVRDAMLAASGQLNPKIGGPVSGPLRRRSSMPRSTIPSTGTIRSSTDERFTGSM